MTAAARLRDLRDHQRDPALVEGAAPVEGRHDEPEPVSITFATRGMDFTSWQAIPHFTVMLRLVSHSTDPEGSLHVLSQP